MQLVQLLVCCLAHVSKVGGGAGQHCRQKIS
jgi:hypothetical protein